MAGLDFLNAGRTLQSAASGMASTVTGGVNDPRDPNTGGNRTLVQSSSRVGFLTEFGGGVSDVMQGRLSLLMLDTLILLMIAFYIWSHKVQGGG